VAAGPTKGSCGSASAVARGRGNGSILRSCGWCRSAACVLWYEAEKAHDEADARRALVAVMRKLAVALYYVGVHNEEFQPRRLFGRIRRHRGSPGEQKSRTKRRSRAEQI